MKLAAGSLGLLGLLALGTGVWAAQTGKIVPRRGPRPRALDPAKLNRACEGCHKKQASEWRGSHHQLAWHGTAFQAAYRREPKRFCRDCHAPELQSPRPKKAQLALGVGCVTCHVADESTAESWRVLAAPKPGRSKAPHAIRRSKALQGSAACASCHEFVFPRDDRGRRGRLMQSTVSEHRRSAHSGKSCADCHMPKRGQHRDHGFRQVRDADFLRSALKVKALRSASGAVVLKLSPGRVGHAMPTGDLFRRLKVSVMAKGKTQVRYLTRHVAPWSQGSGPRALIEVKDDRVGAQKAAGGAVTVRFQVPGTAAVSWRVDYERVAHLAGGSGHAEVESSVLLYRGKLRSARK